MRTERFRHLAFSADIVLPESSEALIDEREFNADERLPYWAELWPSARALARRLLDEPLLPGRVLELGCGVGLPSLALRHRGVDIVASDYYTDALAFVEMNARHNQIPTLPTLLLDWRNPPPKLPRFDLVVAADVLYEPRNVEALSMLLPRLLTGTGSFLLADPGRVHLQAFIDRMAGSDWQMEELEECHEPGPAGDGTRLRVRLFSFHPPPAGTPVAAG